MNRIVKILVSESYPTAARSLELTGISFMLHHLSDNRIFYVVKGEYIKNKELNYKEVKLSMSDCNKNTYANVFPPCATYWEKTVDRLPDPKKASRNYMYILPDNSMWVLSYDGSKMIPIGQNIFTDSELTGGGYKLDKNRIHLTTDKNWNVGQGHLSDVLRLQALTKNAKPALTWYDMDGQANAAIISHDGANDPGRANHKHISIETKMGSTDEIWTRLEIPYGFDIAEIQTHDSNFTTMRGKIRVGHDPGYKRELTFNTLKSKEDFKDENGDIDYKAFFEGTDRWKLMATEDPETGNSAGSDFVIASCNDAGEYYRTVLGLKRSNGYVGIGMKTPTRKLDIDGERIRIRQNFTPASSTATGLKGDVGFDDNYMYRCYADNKWARIPMEKSW